MGCPLWCRLDRSGQQRLQLPEVLREIPRLATVVCSYRPPRQAVLAAHGRKIVTAEGERQYSQNHLEVMELSLANSLIPVDLPSTITAIGKHYGGRLIVQFRLDDATLPRNSRRAPLWSLRSQPSGGGTTQEWAEGQAAGPAAPSAGYAVGTPG